MLAYLFKLIERIRNSDISQGPQFCYNFEKNTGNDPNLDIVSINAHTKFGVILSIYPQGIERNKILT